MERKLRRILRRQARAHSIAGIVPSLKIKYEHSGANILKHIRRGKFVKALRFNTWHIAYSTSNL